MKLILSKYNNLVWSERSPELVTISDIVESPFLLLAVAGSHRTQGSFPSVPSLSLLLGLRSRSRMHTSLIMYGATLSWGRRFANSGGVYQGWTVNNPSSISQNSCVEFQNQARLATQSSMEEGAPAPTTHRSVFFVSRSVTFLLTCKHWGALKLYNPSVTIYFKTKGKKSSKHFTEQSAALGCHWYPVRILVTHLAS